MAEKLTYEELEKRVRELEGAENARKEAEEALQKSEERYKRVLQTAMDGFWLVDLQGRLKEVNDAYCKMSGYNEHELLAMNIIDVDASEALVDSSAHIQKFRNRGVDRFESKNRRKDGSIFEVEVSVQYQPEEGGRIFAFLRDIADRKQSEMALRESEEKYRALFEMESDAIFLIENASGKIIEVNMAASAIYGYTRNEFLEKKNTDMSAEPEETRKATERGLKVVPIRYHRKKDGTVFPVEITATHFKWKGRDVHIAAIRDISFRLKSEDEKFELEKRLQQAQKMESIGTLAGGIAHDFNNILSPIMIHTEMAMMDIASDSPILYNLQRIHKAGERARDLVKQILTLARRREEERIPLKASIIVREAVRFIRSTVPSTIDIQYDFKTERDSVLADPTQMNQIVMNLCTNAAHAMREKGGKLEVILSNQSMESGIKSQFLSLDPGHYLRLTVSDTGSGIPPNIADKIFEPYFTTKGPGEGTGLGLAIVHGIVKRYGGDISFESELGKGTAFHILLPLIDEEVAPVIEPKIEYPGGNEHVLFVDDEKVAVDVMQQLFEKLGYRVTARTSSVEALEAFRHKPEAFDLVITDQTMPNMTGRELTRELRSIRPDIPVILCTGFSEQIDERRAREMGISAFVMKPIATKQIARTIRDVLDKKLNSDN